MLLSSPPQGNCCDVNGSVSFAHGTDTMHVEWYLPKRPQFLKVARSSSRVVSDLAAVRRITLETLQDMRGHNVRYVELRTTPRVLADGTSRQDYIEAVLRVLRDFETAGNTSETRDELSRGEGSSGLIPRLLLSIDRGRTVDDAMVVAKLAVKLRRNELWGAYVVGVDFSGNPTKGAFEDFRSVPIRSMHLFAKYQKNKSWDIFVKNCCIIILSSAKIALTPCVLPQSNRLLAAPDRPWN